MPPAGGLSVQINRQALDRLIRDNPQGADDAMAAAATAIASEIVLSFGTSPAGRTYTRKGITHVASQPGYPPNVDMNALRGSIRPHRVGRLHYQIQDGVAYGVFLELGTSRMAARPFMTPVMEEWRQREFAAFMAANWWGGNG